MYRLLSTASILGVLVFSSVSLGSFSQIHSNGSAGLNELHVPSEYPTIQAAIDDSNDGDTVIVALGTYTGDGNRDIDFLGKAITVRSTDPNDPNIVAATIIDCNGSPNEPHRGFYFHNDEDANSVLDGFTITNGDANIGGAIYCNSSSPAVKNCIFTENVAKYDGGGVFNYDYSSPEFTNCTFTGNSAGQNGGGIKNWDSSAALNNCIFTENVAKYGGGGIYNKNGSLKVINCTFTENSAYFDDYPYPSTFSPGGAMSNFFGSLTIANCAFTGNSAGYGGGGMFNYENSPTVTNCTFIDNQVEGLGGGMYNGGANSSLTVTNCIFIGNSASDGSGMFNGCYYSEVNNCTFTDNSADGFGGGMAHSNGSYIVNNCTFNGNSAYYDGGGLNDTNSVTVVQNCLFTRNSAGQFGGGMHTYLDSNSIVKNCTFSQNSASQWGGGMMVYESTAAVTNSIFIDNSADDGGAILNYAVDYNDRPGSKLLNCTLVGNSAGSEGGAIANIYYSFPVVTNCIIWDNIAIEYPDTNNIFNWYESGITLTYSDIQHGWPGLGNINTDPCFVDVDANDYHLKSAGWRWDTRRKIWTWDDVTSRCIDAGSPGSPLSDELLSIPDDPNNEWGQNLRINMGAFGATAEASIPPYDWALLADLTNDGISDLDDLDILSSLWLNTAEQLYADFNRDRIINLFDFALLAQDWLEQTTWY